MKKYLFVSLLAVGLSISASAEQVVTPGSSGDNPSIDYAGVKTCRITSTNSTNGKLCTANPAIAYGVSASSVAASNYVRLFSTNSIVLNGATPSKIQFNDNNQADEDVTATQDYSFVRPILFPKGLVAQSAVALDASGEGQIEWVIYYREAK